MVGALRPRPSASSSGPSAARYSGSYKPRGSSTPLPRVSDLVDLERAQLLRRPLPADQRRAVPQVLLRRRVPWPARRGVGVARRHQPHEPAGHDPDRRDRASRQQRRARNLRRHQAAHVPARAVLRRLPLPGAARLGRRGPSGARPRLAASRKFRSQQRGPVPGRRVRRSRLHAPGPPGGAERADQLLRRRPQRPELRRPARGPPARGRPQPAERHLWIAQALLDLEHRVRLPHAPARSRRREPGHSGGLDQLGRVPELAPARHRHHRPVPAARPIQRDLRQRARAAERKAQAELRRLPDAAVAAVHSRQARSLARGLGRRPPGALRRSRPARSRSSSSRARVRSRRSGP